MQQPTQIHVREKKRRVFFGPERTLVDRETGEMIPVMTTTFTGADTDFQKFWIAHILQAVDELSNAKMKVVWYILSNVDRHTNRLMQTIEEIAAGAKVSWISVHRTLKVLERYDIIRRRLRAGKHATSSFLQLNPDVLMTGSTGKRRALLVQFQQLELPMHDDRKVVALPRRRKGAA